MRVLVTGASGHVGGAIANHLQALGFDVVGLARHPGRVEGLYGRLEGNLGDTEAAARIARLIEPCEAILHAAAAIEQDPHAPSIALTNCLGTQQVMRLADIWEAERVVYISSVPVVGVPTRLPVTESHPTRPLSAYHASKLYGEHLVGLADERGVGTTILRLTSPVGPGMRNNRILSVFVRLALAGEPLELAGRGGRRQDYVDVRDIADAAEASLRRPAAGLLNIASGRPVSNRELADRCIETLASNSVVQFAAAEDPQEDVVWDVSVERAGQLLGYAPRRSLDDSIRAVAADQSS